MANNFAKIRENVKRELCLNITCYSKLACFGFKQKPFALQDSNHYVLQVNKYIRLIFNLNPRDTVIEIMKSQKLLSINQLFVKETSKLMFQFFNNGLQSWFKCLFKTKKSNYVRTRQTSDLYPSFCRLSTTHQSLKYKGPLVWNQLPLELRNNCKTLKSFDLKIHHYLTTAAKWFS